VSKTKSNPRAHKLGLARIGGFALELRCEGPGRSRDVALAVKPPRLCPKNPGAAKPLPSPPPPRKSFR
jgi:hypothetical protein